MWKSRAAGNVETVDSTVDHFGVTPRQIITSVARAVDELKLPHAVHIHANNLGLPGNWTTTLETMKLLESHRGHLTHIQFHSYGGGAGDEETFSSRVAPLAEYVNAHRNLTVDVGQVVFGETTSMTGDGPVGYYLSKVYKSKWFSSDTECEAGCGIVPIEYKNTSLIHAWQWAIGLEWYLMVDDPVAGRDEHRPSQRRVVPGLSADHPLAHGPDLPARHAQDRAAPRCASKAPWPISIASTRCRRSRSSRGPGPARILGLKHKGHLGPGADADITIYTPDANQETMFALPRFVIKSGRIIVEQGEIREETYGKTLHVAPEYDRDIEKDIKTLVRRVLLDSMAKLSRRRRVPSRSRSGQVKRIMNADNGFWLPGRAPSIFRWWIHSPRPFR